MAHNAKRSQKRRLAKLVAESTGRVWTTNRERRTSTTDDAPLACESLNQRAERQRLERQEAIRKSARTALWAGRQAFQRSQRLTHLRDINETYKVVS